MRVVAAILAAGRSTRLGLDKTMEPLGGKPVWQWSYDTYRAHPEVSSVFVVCSSQNLSTVSLVASSVLLGGSTRQESARCALEQAGDADVLLLHDAARPFVSASVIREVIEAVERNGAAAAAVPVTDTIKDVRGGKVSTLDRSTLYAMQTPQGAKVDLLRRAHAAAAEEATDDMALLERIGVQPELVAGDPGNFKITTMEDLERARQKVFGGETRTGIGYDVHPFSDDPSRVLMLGGVAFPGHRGLEGHSDADVLLHAATDALLGAAALGDIGQHFPNTNPAWKNASSLTFLRAAGELLRSRGWQIVNLDVSVVAESPKIMGRASEIVSCIAEGLGVSSDRVSVKATTNERLGFIGRGEGIAALATATIRS